MAFLYFLTLFIFYACSKATFSQPKVCGRQCRFRFCEANADGLPVVPRPKGSDFILRAPGFAPHPPVCLPRRETKVLKAGEGKIQIRRYYSHLLFPISKWRPGGLVIPSNLFKVFRIPESIQLRGIGRTTSFGDKESLLDGTCFVVPIKKYQVTRNEKTRTKRGGKRDCVSFVARTPELVIDVFYNGIDNIFVEILGPGGIRGTNDSFASIRGGQVTTFFPVSVPGEYTVSTSVEVVLPATPTPEPPTPTPESPTPHPPTPRPRTPSPHPPPYYYKSGRIVTSRKIVVGVGVDKTAGRRDLAQGFWISPRVAQSNPGSDSNGYIRTVVSDKGKKVSDERTRYKRGNSGAQVKVDQKFNLPSR